MNTIIPSVLEKVHSLRQSWYQLVRTCDKAQTERRTVNLDEAKATAAAGDREPALMDAAKIRRRRPAHRPRTTQSLNKTYEAVRLRHQARADIAKLYFKSQLNMQRCAAHNDLGIAHAQRIATR
ncbi:hypothetical protein ACJJTC_006167 [Scirpophaga incertulas]